MRYSRVLLVGLITILALGSTGCYRAVQLERVGWEISAACPDAHFKKDVSISLGGITWGLVRSIACSVEKDDPDVQMVRFIDHVQVVVYKVDDLEKDDAASIGKIVKEALDDDWQLMVRSNEKGDMAWVHYREHGGRIRDMQVAAYDGDEFTIVRISGRLDDLFNRALEDHHLFTNKVKHAARDLDD